MNTPEIDLDAIASGLASTFPDLERVAPCTVLGWGFGSVVVVTAGGIVFRVARLPGIHRTFGRQRALLEALAPRLSVAVPLPQWITGPCEAFEHGTIGYPRVPGRILTEPAFYAGDREALARSFAAFIAELHAVPADALPMLRSRSPEQRIKKERAVRDDVLPVLRARLAASEFALAEAWWDRYLTDPLMMSYDPVVTHGDIWWANVLVDDTGSKITGVLDWEVAMIADPARDFGGLGYLGEDFITAALDAYARLVGRDDAALRHRALLLFHVREFYGLRYANAWPQMRELDDALNKVRRVIADVPRDTTA